MSKSGVGLIALICLALAACSSSPPAGDSASSAPELTACEDPRPQICTADYTPVCGLAGDDEFKTYANACTACADPAVSGHHPGACE